MIGRLVEDLIKNDLFRGKTIVVYGARQVGKTTTVRKILQEYGENGKYLDCELISVAEKFNNPEPENLKSFFGSHKLIVLDEAQNLLFPGKVLKIITDHITNIQIIATGSSSFELAGKISEPMTGRVFEHKMYPLSALEIKGRGDWLDYDSSLEKILRFGCYPEVFSSDDERARRLLMQIASSYLYKDLLRFEGVRKPEVLKNLLILIALQLGSEVSYSELASKLGVNIRTVQNYLDLLEKSFVTFRLYSFSRNLRNELTKAVKIYFYDNGIRNALINNFNEMMFRNDTGALWENLLISERMKRNVYKGRGVNMYFWRTYDQKEVDYIEEEGGCITGFEFKFSGEKRGVRSKQFSEAYDAQVEVISRKNYIKFLE